MIVFAQSDNFVNVFTDNKASDFTVKILKRENFGPNSKIALLELIVPPSKEAKICYINSSVAKFSQCNGDWQRVLRVIDIQKNPAPEKFSFADPIYFDLACNTFEEIRFSLRDEKNKLIDFETDAQTVILFELKNGTV
jgi:hypothetical protein